MFLRSVVLASLLAAMLPGVAAAGRNYTYLDAGYLSTDLDGPADGDGLGVLGSYAVGRNYHLVGGYAFQEFDFGVDVHTLTLGGGYHSAISPVIDILGGAALLRTSVDGGGDETGFELSGGVRAEPTHRVELEGALAYVDLTDGDLALRLHAHYHFTPAIAAGLGLDFDDHATTFSLGVRWALGAAR